MHMDRRESSVSLKRFRFQMALHISTFVGTKDAKKVFGM